MKQIDLAPHHPIQLRGVDYLQVSLERLDLTTEGQHYFPEFDITVQQIEIFDKKDAYLIFTVVSRDTVSAPDTEDKPAADTDAEPRPSIRFSVTVLTSFTCFLEQEPEAALKVFLNSETPLLIAWPYVRGFLGDMVSRTGLPAYHLPLLQIRTLPQSEADQQVNRTTEEK